MRLYPRRLRTTPYPWRLRTTPYPWRLRTTSLRLRLCRKEQIISLTAQPTSKSPQQNTHTHTNTPHHHTHTTTHTFTPIELPGVLTCSSGPLCWEISSDISQSFSGLIYFQGFLKDIVQGIMHKTPCIDIS